MYLTLSIIVCIIELNIIIIGIMFGKILYE